MRDLIMIVLMTVASVGLGYHAFAQDDDSAGDDDSAVEEPAPPEGDLEDVLTSVGEIVEGAEAIKDAKGDRTAMFLAISTLIAAILKIALDVLKMFGGMFKNKNALKITLLVIGFLIALFSQFALGVPWYNALLLGLAGPGAILVNEVSKVAGLANKPKE